MPNSLVRRATEYENRPQIPMQARKTAMVPKKLDSRAIQ
jgi:hypothetical protein